MNSILLNRSLGVAGPQILQQTETAYLLQAIQTAPNIRFDSSTDPLATRINTQLEDGVDSSDKWAHRAGVNSVVIDKWEGR